MGSSILVYFTIAVVAVLVDVTVAWCDNGDTCVTGISPKQGGMNGGTKITIEGQFFSTDKFNYGTGRENLGNSVTMVSGVRSYVCEIHINDCTEKQITCYTSAMVEDTYYVRVAVDGKAVPENKHCGDPTSTSCSFQVLSANTPTIDKLQAVSGPPDAEICGTGKLFTDKVGTNVVSSTNGKDAKITRVWVTGGLCDLLKPDSDEFYKLSLNSEDSDDGEFCCKPTNTHIGGRNITILVDENYGRSAVSKDVLQINGKDKLSMFQTYAVISSSSPFEGSTEGGTRVLMIGKHFDKDVKVWIGGEPCTNVSMINTEQILIHTPKQPHSSLLIGNRGMEVQMWISPNVDQEDDATISAKSTTPDWTEWMDKGQWEKNTSTMAAFASRTKVYFKVPKTSDYKFYMMSAGLASLYVSITGNPQDKVLIGRNTEAQLSIDDNTVQTQKIALNKGDNVYLEVIHKGSGPIGSVQLAVHMYMSSYTEAQSYQARNEKFVVETESTVHDEIQTITFPSNPAAAISMSEIQTMNIRCPNPFKVFHFELYGVHTAPMVFGVVSSSTVESALNNLPFVDPNDKFQVSITNLGDEKIFTIIMPSNKGDYPDIKIKWEDDETFGIIVTPHPEFKGQASGASNMQLQFGTSLSPEIDSSQIDASKLKEAIKTMLSVRCPRYIEDPKSPKPGFFQDFEKDTKWSTGSRTKAFEPFCGRYSVKNPNYLLVIYNWGDKSWPNVGISGENSKLCFAFRGVLQNSIFFVYRTPSGNLKQRRIDAFSSFTDTTRSDYIPEVVEDSDPTAYDIWRYRCVALDTLVPDQIGQILFIAIYKENENKDLYLDNVLFTKSAPSYTGKVAEEFSMHVTNYRINSLIQHERMKLDKWINDKITVTDEGNNRYKVTMKILDCHINLPYISVMNTQTSSIGSVKEYFWPNIIGTKSVAEKIQEASPPITGTYNLLLGKYQLKDVPADADEITLGGMIKNLDFHEFGEMKVTRSGTCAGYKWNVEYITVPGDHTNVKQLSHNLQGMEVKMSAWTEQDGGVLWNPIPGQVLATVHTKPQVVVHINSEPTKCEGDCSFTWTETNTPKLTGVSPKAGSAVESTILTLTGENFLAFPSNASNVVTIGGVSCHGISSTTSQIMCKIGEGSAGEYKVNVYVTNLGSAAHTTQTHTFKYNFAVTGIASPAAGSLAGGCEVVISGTGFSQNADVWIDGKLCIASKKNYTSIVCTVPSGNSPGAKSITVIDGDQEASDVSVTFTYVTPAATILTLSGTYPNQGSVEGGKLITITGTSFGSKQYSDDIVLVGDTIAKVLSWTDTNIMIELPVLNPGEYSLNVKIGASGFAAGSQNITYTFEVTKVSPVDGSFMGGTLITINGAGFSQTDAANHITFGDTVCDVQSATEIMVVCKLDYPGKTHIITNDGNHPVNGKGYAWMPDELTVEEGDLVTFTWAATPGLTSNPGFRVASTDNVTALKDTVSADSFKSSESKTAKGDWSFQTVARSNPYIYWSGFIDDKHTMYTHGKIIVNEKEDIAKYLKFTINNVEAKYKLNSGSSEPLLPSCTNNIPTSVCTTVKTNADIDVLMFKFSLRKCMTPTITGIQPRQLIASKPITITGTGFSPLCGNKVWIDHCEGVECIVDMNLSTENRLVCTIDDRCSVRAGIPLPIDVEVPNKGFAVHKQVDKEARRIVIIPEVNDIWPKTGSMNGGTNVTLNGKNFKLNNPPCKSVVDVPFGPGRKKRSNLLEDKITTPTVLNGPVRKKRSSLLNKQISSVSSSFITDDCVKLDIIDANTMICITKPATAFPSSPPKVLTPELVISDGSTYNTECSMSDPLACTFHQAQEYGPLVIDVKTPVDMGFMTMDVDILGSGITEPNQVIKISGERFGTNTKEISVLIGESPCLITGLNDNLITCQAGDVIHGTQTLNINRQSNNVNGYADFINPVYRTIIVVGTITSIIPSTVGTGGCTKITINGIGFHPSNSTVTVAGQPCIIDSDTSVTTKSIKCTVPKLSAGQKQVTVMVFNENLVSSVMDFSDAVTPIVTAVAPSVGSGGLDVTITGNNFGNNIDSSTVTIGDVNCALKSLTNTEAKCTTGNHYGGHYDVKLNVLNRGCSTGIVKFQYDIEVGKIEPDEGSTGGGQTIIVSGKGFDPENTMVKICGQECKVDPTSVTLTQLHCETPKASSMSSCDVFVKISSGASATKTGGYTYTEDPTVTNVTPNRGGTGGGTTITIEGTGFGSSVNDIIVSIAGSVCDIDMSKFTSTSIVCVTNSHKPSVVAQVEVKIRSAGIAEQIKADFEYIDMWSSKFTWGGSSLPQAGDLLVIPSDMKIIFDLNTTPVYKIIVIQGGHVVFQNSKTANLTLNAEIILITDGGKLEVGTESEPFEGVATIQLHGHVNAKDLPLYGTKALALRNGSIELHGKPVTHPWTLLNSTVLAGDDSITVMDQIDDWQVGDEIIIATTSHRHSQNQNEKHVIKQITGNTITLQKPLAFKHMGEDFTYNGRTLQARAEVGLLTRNVVFRGSDDKSWNEKVEACEEGHNTGEFATQKCFQGRFGEEIGSSQFGAHIIIHGLKPNQNDVKAHIENTEITYAGQAFKLGRYAIHFHLNGDMSGSYVRKCAIHHSFNRALVIHGGNNVLVDNNAAYNIAGGAFFLEDGVETGNILQSNLAVFVKQSTSLQNDDITPAAFWVTNPNNTIKKNHAAGGTHFGFWYRIHSKPDGPSYDPNYCPQKIPLGVFADNVVHSHGWFGLWIFQKYTPVDAQPGMHCSSDVPKGAEYFRLTAWNNEKGAESVGGGAVQFKQFLLVNNEDNGIEIKLIDKLSTPYDDNQGFVVADTIIVASQDGLDVESVNKSRAGIVLPYSSGLIVKGMTYMRFTGKHAVYKITRIQGSTSDNVGGFTYQMSSHSYIDSTNIVFWRWINEAVIHDMDGTVTGESPNSKVVPTMATLPPTCKTDVKYSTGLSGSVCSGDVEFRRFAFNEVEPSSLFGKNCDFTNQYGASTVKFAAKSLTHKNGLHALLVVGQTYQMTFVNAPTVTNFSYSGILYDMKESDRIILTYSLAHDPSVIEVTGQPVPSQNKTVTGLDINGENADFAVVPRADGNKTLYDTSILLSGKSANTYTWGDRVDRPVKFNVYKCYYPDCKPPPDPDTLPPPTDTPLDAVEWHNPDIWRKARDGSNTAVAMKVEDATPEDLLLGTLPSEGMDINITTGTWVRINRETPPVNYGTLFLLGYLEIEHNASKTLTVSGAMKISQLPSSIILSFENIIISDGRMFIGWPSKPMENNVTIELRGTKSSPEAQLPDVVGGPVIGSKAIAVFGGLEAHGLPVPHSWLRLAHTAKAGSSTIMLTEAPGWKTGDVIVISTTAFGPRPQSEKRTISLVSGSTISLDKPLEYTHIGGREDIGNGNFVEMAADVGLLSRNVKFVGIDFNHMNQPGGMEKLGFGGRIVVSSFLSYKGYARFSNVEFANMGQEGYKDKSDPRFALAYLDVGTIDHTARPSSVSDCSFHNIYNTAIGVFGTSELNVTNNVVYKTVGPSLIIEDSNHVVQGNMITMMMYPGLFKSQLWYAAVELHNSHGVTLQDNSVSGSDMAAYRVDGESCTEDPKYKNNQGHSSLDGVVMLPDENDGFSPCTLINNFIVWRNWDFGLYLQIQYLLEMKGNIMIENRVGSLPLIYKPSSKNHLVEDKYVKITDGSYVGKSSKFDCGDLKADNSLNNILDLTSLGRSWSNKGEGMTGACFAVFMSTNNMAPTMSFSDVMSYQAIKGMTQVTGTVFKNYGQSCGGKFDYAIATPPFAEDGLHPMYLNNVQLDGVLEESKILFKIPSVNKNNPSDCVDMSCDGLKQTFLKDQSGSYLNKKGATVIPMPEMFWDNDARYGLGDYRVPTTLLTDVTGRKRDITDIAGTNKRGIFKDNTCHSQSSYNGWMCLDLDYVMLHLESMDSDSETRRISPVAVVGDTTNAINGFCSDCYLDLLNGPQDHGWCHGYSCQKRLSLFPVVLAADKSYDIVPTGTTPQGLRLHWLAQENTQAVVVGINYQASSRLDVYAGTTYVMPNNGKMENGKLILSAPINEKQYMPVPSDSSNGDNYFDQTRRYLYVLLKGGNEVVEIKTTPEIVLSFEVPSMTVDQFFEENLVANIALYFNIPADKIRVATSVRESRRKRQASLLVTAVISNPPRNLTDIDPSDLTSNELQNLTQQFINAYQLNQLGNTLNLDILSFQIVQPLPGSDTVQWKMFANLKMDSVLDTQVPNYLKVVEEPEVIHEGAMFKVQPSVQLFDVTHKAVSQAGSIMLPWKLTASLIKVNTVWGANVQLAGQQTVDHSGGFFNFTDLAVTHSGTYKIRFTVSEPTEASHFIIESKEITVDGRTLGAGIVSQPKSVVEGQAFDVAVELIDAITKEKIPDVTWKGHSWTASVSLYQPDTYIHGQLTAPSAPVIVDPTTGTASFTGIRISQKGRYFLGIHYITTPQGYDFTGAANVYIDVYQTGYKVPVVDKTFQVKLRFVEDFSLVKGQEIYFAGTLHNKLLRDYTNVLFSDYKLSEGSIFVEFTAGGSSEDLEAMLKGLWTNVKAGYSLKYNGKDFQADKAMWVNGDVYGEQGQELHVAVIVIIILVLVVLIAVLVGLLVYKYYSKKVDLKNYKLESREPTITRRGLSFLANTEDYFRVPEYKRTPSSLSSDSNRTGDDEKLILSKDPKSTSTPFDLTSVKQQSYCAPPNMVAPYQEHEYPGTPSTPTSANRLTRPTSTSALQLYLEKSNLSTPDN